MNNNIFQELIQAYRENKLAHAFLIETNDKEKSYHSLLQFLKILNCPDEYKEGCSNCNLCHLIDTNSLPSLLTVYPDGINIKKEQILEVKRAFQTKPVFSKYNMYIIMDAENLNSSSANTMLKFLEEPEDSIIGFFITNNKENVIDTIKSRCQILLDYYDVDISKQIPSSFKEMAISYVKELETSGIDAVFYNRDVLLPEIKDKKDLFYLFEALLDIYRNLFFAVQNLEVLKDEYQEFKFLLKKNVKYFERKVDLIMEILDEINYNLNISLVLDRFVLEGGDS